MSLIGLVLTLVVVGVLLWLLNNYVPMDSKIKSIVNVVVSSSSSSGSCRPSVCWAQCRTSASDSDARIHATLSWV